MTFDLIALARRQAQQDGDRRRSVTLRKIEPTRAIESDLRSIIMQVVNFWGLQARDVILPLYEREVGATGATFVDQPTDRLREAFDSLEQEAHRLVLSLGPLVADWTVRVEEWHRNRWTDGVRSSLGLDIEILIRNLSAAPEVQAFQEWASGLIRNVSEEAQRRIETAVFRGVAANTPRRKIAKEVGDAMAIARRRAQLIARDQANKLSGKLDELRHREAGVRRYRWETARDERVRSTHRANQGKVFRWDRPPRVTGHPRTEINCRCTAQAWIPLVEGVDPRRTEADVFENA